MKFYGKFVKMSERVTGYKVEHIFNQSPQDSTQQAIFSAGFSRSGACPSKCPFGQPHGLLSLKPASFVIGLSASAQTLSAPLHLARVENTCNQSPRDSTQNTIPLVGFSRSGPRPCPFGQLEQFTWPSVTDTSLILHWPAGAHANSLCT